MKKIKFNYEELRVGDMVLCGSYSPMAATIRAVTGGFLKTFDMSIPSHVGIVIEASGQKLVAEMLGKGLCINSLEDYNKGGIGKFIVDIKRHSIYDKETARKRLNDAVFNDFRHSLDYDFKGLLEFIDKRIKDEKGRYYCSEYFVHQTKLDGLKYPTQFMTKVSPKDLNVIPDWFSVNYKL